MVRNERKYEEAVRLRERGFTLQEIARYCDVSKSTASKWLKNNAMSAAITTENKRRAAQDNAKRLRLINKARGPERAMRYREAKHSASTEFAHYCTDPLFVAGVTLYSAHGDLNDQHKIRFSTTDTSAHRIFIRFAKVYLGIEASSIRFWPLLYPGQTESLCLQKWKRATSLPYTQFGKTQYTQHRPKKTLHSGVGNTIIGSTVLQIKLTNWVTLTQKQLAK